MNKRELRKQLSNLYLQGLLNGFWEIDDKEKPNGYLSCKVHHNYGEALDESEKLVYNRVLSSENMITKAPWKQAVENYFKIKNSPLQKALNEGENK